MIGILGYAKFSASTGTSRILTNAISKDSSTVKALVNRLNNVSNNTLEFKTQCSALTFILTSCDDHVPAKALQKCARATKQILRASWEDARKSPGGKIHPGSQAWNKMVDARHAYELAKAIQYNDSSMLK
ncbi:hypothetical protein [Serratia liquefaciens]|uniref:hypothetical protein n=1 Tax=Serratia liquefaciens TaxID=614 RepID=UPI002157D3FF|nr:hypothetical protein [Serratia liquefaciens]